MRNSDTLFIRGVVADRNTFAVVLGPNHSDPEDTWSAMITHRAEWFQPWARGDVSRDLCSLIWHLPDNADDTSDATFIALSTQADVYRFPAGASSTDEKIPGAGLFLEDAPEDAPSGRGYMADLALVGGDLFAVGLNQQLYKRDEDGKWDWFHRDLLPPVEDTYRELVLIGLAGERENIYLLAAMYPEGGGRPLTPEEEAEAIRLYDLDRDDEAYAITSRARGPRRVAEGRVYHWNGSRWSDPIELPDHRTHGTPVNIADILYESENVVWLVGSDGAILRGNATDGFENQRFIGDSQQLTHIARYRDGMFVTSDEGLYHFDGHRLVLHNPPVDKSVNRGALAPAALQSVDDVLFYFDATHGVHRWDGTGWEHLSIPSKLLDPNYDGSPLE